MYEPMYIGTTMPMQIKTIRVLSDSEAYYILLRGDYLSPQYDFNVASVQYYYINTLHFITNRV